MSLFTQQRGTPDSVDPALTDNWVRPCLRGVQVHVFAARHWLKVAGIVVVWVAIAMVNDVRLVGQEARAPGNDTVFEVGCSRSDTNGDVLAGLLPPTAPRNGVRSAHVLGPHVVSLLVVGDNAIRDIGHHEVATPAPTGARSQGIRMWSDSAVVTVDEARSIPDVVAVSAAFGDGRRLFASALADAGRVRDLGGRWNLTRWCHAPSMPRRYRQQ